VRINRRQPRQAGWPTGPVPKSTSLDGGACKIEAQGSNNKNGALCGEVTQACRTVRGPLRRKKNPYSFLESGCGAPFLSRRQQRVAGQVDVTGGFENEIELAIPPPTPRAYLPR